MHLPVPVTPSRFLKPCPERARLFRKGNSVPFVAQLLANRIGLAQTRPRRRESAQEGVNRYRSVSALGEPANIGTLKVRSV